MTVPLKGSIRGLFRVSRASFKGIYKGSFKGSIRVPLRDL